MTAFVKKSLYTLNILALAYMVFILLFFVNSTIMNYRSLVVISTKSEYEYNKTLNKYKKLALFILENNLPEGVNYFNSLIALAYDLPPVNTFLVNKPEANKVNNNDGVIGCLKNKCIQIYVDKNKVLNKLTKQLGQSEIVLVIPIKKIKLLKGAASIFLATHRFFFIINFLCFFALYLCQSVFLFRKNLKLVRVFTSLLKYSNKNKRKLVKQSSECNKLYDEMIFAKELVGKFFAHYMHQLLTRATYIEKIDMGDVFSQIKRFLGYEIAKSNLTFTLDCEDSMKTIESDSEIIFILLLNLAFKATFRAKEASAVIIKVFQNQSIINIAITDTGYEYNLKPSEKITICALPALILEKLCQKIGMRIAETRKGELNTISMETVPIFTMKRGSNKVSDNIIRINLYEKED